MLTVPTVQGSGAYSATLWSWHKWVMALPWGSRGAARVIALPLAFGAARSLRSSAPPKSRGSAITLDYAPLEPLRECYNPYIVLAARRMTQWADAPRHEGSASSSDILAEHTIRLFALSWAVLPRQGFRTM